MYQYIYIYILVCRGLSIDDVGVSRNTVFQEIRPGAGFETGGFVKKKLGRGYRRTTRDLGEKSTRPTKCDIYC